jgi:hypothetical protein
MCRVAWKGGFGGCTTMTCFCIPMYFVGVLGMYPKATWVVGKKMMMMSQRQ